MLTTRITEAGSSFVWIGSRASAAVSDPLPAVHNGFFVAAPQATGLQSGGACFRSFKKVEDAWAEKLLQRDYARKSR
ncbi:hypothetical protein ON010_g4053 [Phytophthora cinnamomi]|nr:hypothetical protein ON010_g4053 [Phytophthora cinnamomi]